MLHPTIGGNVRERVGRIRGVVSQRQTRVWSVRVLEERRAMSTGQRLYVKFATGTRFYVYDASSNQILQASQELWNVIDEYLTTRSEAPAEAAAIVPVAAQRDSMDPVCLEIEEGLAHGFLAPCNVHSMCLYLDDAELRDAIARQIAHITLELTEACNARCHYCPYVRSPQRCDAPRRMNWATLTNALALLMSRSSDVAECSVSFWGGEPLLELPLMRRAVEHVAREYPNRAVRYQFTTNGTLFSDSAVRFLIDHDVTVVVSMDGPAVVHDRHRVLSSGKGMFDRIVAGLQTILREDSDYYRKRVRFHCVLTPGVDISAVAEFFGRNELCRGHSVTFQPVGSTRWFADSYGTFAKEDQQRLRSAMREEVVAIQHEPSNPLAVAGVRSLLPIATRPRTQLGTVISPNGCCVPLLRKMHVAAGGDTYLCERMDHDNRVGNVNHGGISVDAVVDLVREYCDHGLEDCRSCWAMRLCRTCYRDFMSENKWSAASRAETCDESRSRIMEALEDYAAVLESNPHAFDHLNRDSDAVSPG